MQLPAHAPQTHLLKAGTPVAEAVPGHTAMLRTQATSAAPAAGSAAGRRRAAVLPALAQPPILPTDRSNEHQGLGPAESAGSLPAPGHMLYVKHTHKLTHQIRSGLGTHTSVDESARMPLCIKSLP